MSIAKIKGNSWFKKGLASKSSETRHEATQTIQLDAGATFGPSQNMDTVNVPKQVSGKLNAFDIISLSTGFDLSGLFTETNQKKEVHFTSKHSASDIISKLESVATGLKLKVKKKDGGVVKLEGLKEGRKGALTINAEIFEFTPCFHRVEMKKTSGDTLEYQKTLKQDIRPALKDIVWAWNGEQQQE